MALLLTRHWRRIQVTNFLSVRHLSRNGGRDSSGKLTSEKRVDSTDDDPAASTDKEKADAPSQGGSSRSTDKEKARQVAKESSKTRHKDGIELEVGPDTHTGLYDYDKWEEKESRAQEKAVWDREQSRNRFPYSIRILLESAIRNYHRAQDVTKEDVEMIIDKQVEIPFIPAPVLQQIDIPDPKDPKQQVEYRKWNLIRERSCQKAMALLIKSGEEQEEEEEGLRYPSFGAFTLIGSEAWVKWKTGPKNYYIFNVDGSYNPLNGRAGVGGVLRNHIGDFKYGFFSNCVRYNNIEDLEIEAILRAVRRGWAMKLPRLIIQTDCAQAELLINWAYIKPGSPKSAKIYEIRWYLAQKQTWDARIIPILREGNLCADFLAKRGAEGDIMEFEFYFLYEGVTSTGIWILDKIISDGFFRRFRSLLDADLIGHWYQRFPNEY